MSESGNQTDLLTILMAEDDPDDRFLIERAFAASGLPGGLCFVEDGEELMDYLFRRAKYADIHASPRPSVILLDLNMPRKDGREALWEIKQRPELKALPVVVLTTSDSQTDKDYCSELGVCDYVTKPGSFSALMALMEKIRALSAF